MFMQGEDIKTRFDLFANQNYTHKEIVEMLEDDEEYNISPDSDELMMEELDNHGCHSAVLVLKNGQIVNAQKFKTNAIDQNHRFVVQWTDFATETDYAQGFDDIEDAKDFYIQNFNNFDYPVLFDNLFGDIVYHGALWSVLKEMNYEDYMDMDKKTMLFNINLDRKTLKRVVEKSIREEYKRLQKERVQSPTL